MHCVKCEKPLEPDEKVCIQCGFDNTVYFDKSVKLKKCRFCNKLIPRKSKICLICKRIQDDAALNTLTVLLLVAILLALGITIIDMRNMADCKKKHDNINNRFVKIGYEYEILQ